MARKFTPVMSEFFSGRISGDWIYEMLRDFRTAAPQYQADLAGEFLDELDVDKIQPYVLFGALDLTLWMAAHPSRQAFGQRVQARLLAVYGDQAEVRRLLEINGRFV